VLLCDAKTPTKDLVRPISHLWEKLLIIAIGRWQYFNVVLPLVGFDFGIVLPPV
jgi:hypothetical protein